MANILQKAASNVFFKIRRNIFGIGVPKPLPPTPPSEPPAVGSVPRFTPPPVGSVDKEQPGVVYKAPDKKMQFEQWQETQPPTPFAEPTSTETPESEDQISFIPISSGRLGRSAFEVPAPQVSSGQTPQQVRQRNAEHIMLIAARPMSPLNIFFDEIQKFAAEIPLLKLVISKPRSQEEMIAQAVQRYVSENPHLAESQVVRDLQVNTGGIYERYKDRYKRRVDYFRVVPEEKIAEEFERPLYEQQQENYLPIRVLPGRFISFPQWDVVERFVLNRIPSAFGRVAMGAAKEAVSRGAVFGGGLVNTAMRGVGGWAARGAIALGSQMASAGAALAGSTLGLPIALIIVGIVVLVSLFLLTGPMFTRQAAFVGTGGAGDLLAQGNQYVAVEIISSKTSLRNEELPQEITFKINIKERKQSFTSGPNVTAVITAAGASGSRTLAQESWSGKTNEIKVMVGDDLEDINLIVNVTAKASVFEQPNEQTAVNSTSVSVGSPPDDCPKIWPTPYGFISLGPNTSGTHASAEAVDIGNGGSQGAIRGAPIRSTTKGKVSYDCYSPLYGICVRVTTQCQGKSVEIIYAHMLDGSRVQEGQDVNLGTVLGQVGSTGNTRCVPWPNCDASHLHYEFFKPGGQVTIRMSPPNIPTGSSW